MSKKVVIAASMLMLALILPVALFASGTSDDGSITIPEGVDLVTPERIGNPNAEITLTWAPQQVYGPFSDIEARTSYLRGRLEEWSRANPNVKIVATPWGGSSQTAMSKFIIDAAAGAAPDVAQIDDSVDLKWLRSLDEFFTDEELDDFFEWTLGLMIDPTNDQLKKIKFATGGHGFWYRNDLIDEAPRSWDEVAAHAKRIQAEEGIEHGVYAPLMSAWTMFNNIFPMWTSQGLPGLEGENGRPTFGEKPIERQAMIDIFTIFNNLIEDGLMPKTVLDFSNGLDIATEMARDRVAMSVGPGNLPSQMRQAGMSEADIDNWTLTYHPQMTADAPRRAAAGGWSWGFFSEDDEKLALAVDMIKHLYVSVEGMAGWCTAGNYMPTRHSAYDAPAFQGRFIQAQAAILATAQPWPNWNANWGSMTNESRNAMEAMYLGQLTPEEAVDKFYQDVLNSL